MKTIAIRAENLGDKFRRQNDLKVRNEGSFWWPKWSSTSSSVLLFVTVLNPVLTHDPWPLLWDVHRSISQPLWFCPNDLPTPPLRNLLEVYHWQSVWIRLTQFICRTFRPPLPLGGELCREKELPILLPDDSNNNLTLYLHFSLHHYPHRYV